MKWRKEENYWQRDIRKRDKVLAIIQGLGGAGVLAYLFYHSWIGYVFLMPLLFFHYRTWKEDYAEKKKEKFQRQFKEALQSLRTVLNVGYSIENAVREVQKELATIYGKEALITKEFSYLVRQLEMNIPVEQAWKAFADRVEISEVTHFVTILSTIKRSGGDMIAVLKQTIQTICMKLEVQQEIYTIIVAKQMEFKIMSEIPMGIIIYLKMSFPEFLSVLYGSIVGKIVMTVCLAIYFVAYQWGRKILEIEV